MKKIKILLMSMLFIFFSVSSTITVNATDIQEDASVKTFSAIYPTRIWVTKHSSKIADYLFFTHIFRGQSYRGYLSFNRGFSSSVGSEYTYVGYVYRHDLEYTAPYKKKDPVFLE